MMNGMIWLRISSIISLLFAAGHTLGGRKAWSPIGDSPVLESMRTFRFDVEGVSRTYLDFYRGFGYSLTVFLLLQGVLLWQLSTIAARQPLQARPLAASFAIATIAGGILTWIFILPIPTIFSAVLSVCLVMAVLSLR